jgi:hypothetical protein
VRTIADATKEKDEVTHQSLLFVVPTCCILEFKCLILSLVIAVSCGEGCREALVREKQAYIPGLKMGGLALDLFKKSFPAFYNDLLKTNFLDLSAISFI